MLVSTGPLFNYKSDKLEKFEPEKKKEYFNKIVAGLLLIAVVVLGVLYIILDKIGQIGNEKSQTISMVTKTVMLYNMTWTLLPIHKFSNFYLYEIDHRMKCFSNDPAKVDLNICMEYCQEKHSIVGVT